MASPVNFTKTFKEYLPPVFLKCFPKIEGKEHFQTAYEISIILISKPGNDAIRKENYRLISLMNIETKILNKILANQIQQQIKKE